MLYNLGVMVIFGLISVVDIDSVESVKLLNRIIRTGLHVKGGSHLGVSIKAQKIWMENFPLSVFSVNSITGCKQDLTHT